MSNKQLECPRCGKRCGNAGALKTHMKTHKKPEPKSGSLMKWIVKREPVKSESKKKVNDMVELQPIVKTRQLKLRKAPIREPTVVTNPARPRPPRAPRRSKQHAIDTSPFVAPARLTDTDLDKRSPQFRIAHVQHFNTLKSDFPVLDKTMYHEVNKSCLGVSLRRFQAWFQQYESDLKKVNTPKLKIRRYYRDAKKANPDKWRKPPGKGGHTEADRRRIYSGWVSQARKELLADNFADIWKRHEEVGFIAKCDGSEENKIILRDGKISCFFLPQYLLH